jgi:hypothetical protein
LGAAFRRVGRKASRAYDRASSSFGCSLTLAVLDHFAVGDREQQVPQLLSISKVGEATLLHSAQERIHRAEGNIFFVCRTTKLPPETPRYATDELPVVPLPKLVLSDTVVVAPQGVDEQTDGLRLHKRRISKGSIGSHFQPPKV